MSAHAVRVWDVFAGAGAMTHAMGEAIRARGARCEVVALVESASAERMVLADRYPGVWTPGDVGQLARLPRAEVGLAGYPCPGNSPLSTRFGGARGAEHPATRMVSQLLRLLDGEAPPVLVLENTTGCLSSPGGGGEQSGGDDPGEGGFFRWLSRRLAAAGYTHGEWRTLCTSSATPAYSRSRVFLVAWMAPACLSGVLLGCEGASEPARGDGLGILLADPGLSPAAGRVPALRAGKAAPSVMLPGEAPRELGPEAAHALHGLPPGYCEAGGGDKAQVRMIGNGVAAVFRLVAARVAEGILVGRAGGGWERALGPGAMVPTGAAPCSGAWISRDTGVEFYRGQGAGRHVRMETVGPASLRALLAQHPGRKWSVGEMRNYVEVAASLARNVGPRGGELLPLMVLGWGGWEGPTEGARVEVQWARGRWYGATVSSSGRHPPHLLCYDDGDEEDVLVLPDRVVGPKEDRPWRFPAEGGSSSNGGEVGAPDQHGREGPRLSSGGGPGGPAGVASPNRVRGTGAGGGSAGGGVSGNGRPRKKAKGLHAGARAWCQANEGSRHVKHDGRRMETCVKCVADGVRSALERGDAAYVERYRHWWEGAG